MSEVDSKLFHASKSQGLRVSLERARAGLLYLSRCGYKPKVSTVDLPTQIKAAEQRVKENSTGLQSSRESQNADMVEVYSIALERESKILEKLQRGDLAPELPEIVVQRTTIHLNLAVRRAGELMQKTSQQGEEAWEDTRNLLQSLAEARELLQKGHWNAALFFVEDLLAQPVVHTVFI